MSNYFVKRTTRTGEIEFIPLEEDSVYTICPDCGKKHPIDLGGLMQADSEFDFCDTRVFCMECSKRKQDEREGVQPHMRLPRMKNYLYTLIWRLV